MLTFRIHITSTKLETISLNPYTIPVLMHCIRKTIGNTTLITHTNKHIHRLTDTLLFLFSSKNPAQIPTHNSIFESKHIQSDKWHAFRFARTHAHIHQSERKDMNRIKRKETAEEKWMQICFPFSSYTSCTILEDFIFSLVYIY